MPGSSPGGRQGGGAGGSLVKIERHHLIQALESAIQKLSAASTGRHTVPVQTVWEVIGQMELTVRLAKTENGGSEDGNQERSPGGQV